MIKEIQLVRYSGSNESTLGLLMLDWQFFCHVLEDEYRAVKVIGDTRIPGGLFELALRKVLSPKTIDYRDRFPEWFKWHIQILEVPGFEYAYLHIGNDDDDTEGCLLLADGANNNTIEPGFISSSAPAFERFYKKIYPILKAGHVIKIRILDVQDLVNYSEHPHFIGPPNP